MESARAYARIADAVKVSSNRSLVKERGVSLATPIVYQSRTRMSTTFFKEFHGYGFKRVPLYGMPFATRPNDPFAARTCLLGISSNFALLWCAPLRGRGVLNEMVSLPGSSPESLVAFGIYCGRLLSGKAGPCNLTLPQSAHPTGHLPHQKDSCKHNLPASVTHVYTGFP